MSSKIKIEIVAGVEGKSCYINGRRVCGNKPWGGGSVIYKGDAEIGAVMQAIGVHYNNKLPYPWHSVKEGELPQAGKVCMFGYQGKLYKGFMYKDGALHFDDEFPLCSTLTNWTIGWRYQSYQQNLKRRNYD